jgi:hypothetical protein
MLSKKRKPAQRNKKKPSSRKVVIADVPVTPFIHRSHRRLNVFGWRGPSAPDPRDQVYSFNPLMSIPAELDLSGRFEKADIRYLDQGSLGSCGAWSGGLNDIYDDLIDAAWKMPSMLFIYYNARWQMGIDEGHPTKYLNQDSGVYTRSMLKSLVNYGWCDAELWPYDIKQFTKKPPPEAYAQAASRRALGYSLVPSVMESVRGALTAGDTFALGLPVYANYGSAQNAGIWPDPQPGEKVVGGHLITAVGFKDATQRVKCLNQWGNWGDGGYVHLSYNFVTKYCECYALQGGNPNVSPLPPPTPAEAWRIAEQSGRRIVLENTALSL